MKRINKSTFFFPQKAGRNNEGRITVWHRGGGNKKLYRLIDFRRTIFNIPALVININSDPYRTSHIALIRYKTGLLSYILSPTLISPGSIIYSGPFSDIENGNALPLYSLPIGSFIHNIELKPGKGGQLVRSAGNYAKIIKKNVDTAIIRSHSGKYFNISNQSMATLGIVSFPSHFNNKLKKAGESRWYNKRPVVRGVAMNPIDHPHGGGEGRSKGGRHPVTPWGKLTKGKPTSNSHKRSLTHNLIS